MTAAAAVAMTAGAALAASPTLDAVKQRGRLICGINVGLAGFAVPDDKGVWRGFEVDFCRAVGAAVLGDPDRVTYKPLTGKTRFPALQSGEVDLLARITTWTLKRDVNLGFDFVGITFYDGQGFLDTQGSRRRRARGSSTALRCASRPARRPSSTSPISSAPTA